MTMRVGNPLRRRRKATRDDPYGVIPIPPRSVVRLAASSRNTPGWKRDQGKIFRIGHYGKTDGLDCIWLVDDDGEYEQTTDHDALFKYFDVIVLSDETDLYGKERPRLPRIRRAEKPDRAVRASGRPAAGKKSRKK